MFACEPDVNGTVLVSRTRQILVPNPVVLMMVPFPQPGPTLAAILIQPFGVPVA
jgi:hypothetical protein